MSINKIGVFFHDFDEKNNCLADITLCDTGVVISDFKVKPGLGGGVMVHMPNWMHTRWSYVEIQWSEVCQIVTREYLSAVSAQNRKNGGDTNLNGTQICTFYALVVKTEIDATITIIATKERIEGIHLVCTKDKGIIQVFMPRQMNHCWNIIDITWDQVVEKIKDEYRRTILGESREFDADTVKIEFENFQESTTCMLDVKLPHKKNAIKGFRIKKIQENEKVIISMPKWMKYWHDNRVTWRELCDLIIREYNKYIGVKNPSADGQQLSNDTLTLLNDDVTKKEVDPIHSSMQPIKEKDEFGRIKNAEKSSFIFYPRTVLRAVGFSNSNGSEHSKNLYDLVVALNKGSMGGIGLFEISILEWIAKLRYITSTMLLDLIKAGYVSFGWRSDVTQAKLGKIINRMADYGLVTTTRFVMVNDDGSLDGNLDGNSCSGMRIMTLGQNGSIFLHELGKSTTKYNAFDIFQDGNTVKRFLAANQWLIYWLKTYKDEIGEGYEINCVIRLKGADYLAARVYASVTVNDLTMIAEPVRRVEKFEVDSNKQWLCEKIERLSLLFDNLDQLYHDKDEISFSQRPIIVIVCEDDEHIFEVWEFVKMLMTENNNQEIWFSCDLRIFNYNKRGKRFLRFDGEALQPVDLKRVLGVDKEL